MPDRFSKFRVLVTKRLKEFISLSKRHEAIRIVYWKLVKFPSLGMFYSHYELLCHSDHFSVPKFILFGRMEMKLLNFSLSFSSSHIGRFFSTFGGIFPTRHANYCSGIISSSTYLIITTPKSNLWAFRSPIDMLS